MTGSPERGTVKWFDEKKGGGYIAPEAGGDDWYVNFRSIVTENPKAFKTLAEGQTVEFERTNKEERHIPDRQEAKNVRVVR